MPRKKNLEKVVTITRTDAKKCKKISSKYQKKSDVV